MIRGMHAMFYSSRAEELRAFFRDKLGLKGTDVGGGWLIFDAPEADLGVHPTEGSDVASGSPIFRSTATTLRRRCASCNRAVSSSRRRQRIAASASSRFSTCPVDSRCNCINRSIRNSLARTIFACRGSLKSFEEKYRGQVRSEGVGKGGEGDARAQRGSLKKRLWQESNEQEAGNRNRAVGARKAGGKVPKKKSSSKRS